MAISVELGDPLERFVDDLLRDGRYNSKSEILREGVRLIQERETRLAALDVAIIQGIADDDSGRTVPLEEAFAALRAKYKARL
ncbi:MAG: type II toxin-antitoxin system ParD family antitoxin [Caulobacteraceae bacterium]